MLHHFSEIKAIFSYKSTDMLGPTEILPDSDLVAGSNGWSKPNLGERERELHRLAVTKSLVGSLGTFICMWAEKITKEPHSMSLSSLTWEQS